MPDRVFIRKRLFILITGAILLMSACSTAEPATTPESQPPTPQPEATATPAPTETSVPSPTLEPSEMPQLTKTTIPNPLGKPDLSMSLPAGDPERGGKLGLKYQCATCHITFSSGPGPAFVETEGNPGMPARVESRLADPAYHGFATSIEEYLLESIIDPEAYIVAGEWSELMNTYDVDKYSEEDLADLIAWLLILN